MPALSATVGAYCGVEHLKRAINDQTNDRDDLILEHLNAASRDLELWLGRRFVPVTATNAYRWPPFHVAASWEVWTEEDLLSVSLLQVAAAGQNAEPVTLTHYWLEPQAFGPPYNRVEVDLSSSDVFQSGPTPQRGVQITGQWGYCATTVPAGTLAAAITSATQTRIGVSVPTTLNQGDVLLVDAEALSVDVSPQLASGTLAVRRGVNGTVATTHSNGAALAVYRAPDDVRRLVRADAIAAYTQDLAAWGKSIGSAEMQVEFQGKAIQSLRQRVERNYRRRMVAAV